MLFGTWEVFECFCSVTLGSGADEFIKAGDGSNATGVTVLGAAFVVTWFTAVTFGVI